MSLSLVGVPLLVLLTCAIVLFSVVALVGGRRLQRAGRAKWAVYSVRTVALVLSQVMAVALVGAIVNRQYGFFVSWGDLFGTAKVTTTSQNTGASGPLLPGKNTVPNVGGSYRASGRTVYASHQSPWPKRSHVYPKSALGWGRVDMYLYGPQSHIYGQVQVLLPPNWTPHPARPYPVVEILPGFPGTFTTMTGAFGVRTVIENAVAHNKLRAPIVVSVQDHAGRDSECINSQLGQWATWLAKDVPTWLATHVGATNDPAARTTLGFSMGGYCANMLTVKYPQVFAGSISLSGYTAPAFQAPQPLQRTPAMMRTYDLAPILFAHPPRVRMWMQTDPQDLISYPATAHFLARHVQAPASVTVFVSTGVGHNFRVISDFMPPALTWLTHALPAFAK